MALDFMGEDDVQGMPVWRFRDPLDGRMFSTENPIQAMQLGAPKPGTGPRFGAQQPAATPPPEQPGWQQQSGPHGATVMTSAPVQAAGSRTISQAQKDELNRRVAANNAPPTPVPVATPQQPQQAPVPRSGLTAETLAQQPVSEQPSAPSPGVPGMAPEGTALDPSVLERRRIVWGSREGGWRPETQETGGIAPERRDDLIGARDDLAAREEETSAMRAELLREQLGNEYKQNILQSQRLNWELQDQQRLLQEKEREDSINRARLDAEEESIAKRSPNTEQYWSERGGGSGKLLSALMIGLSELGNAISGGGKRNMAADLLEKDIDRELDLQAAAIAASKDGVAKKKNAYAERLARGIGPEQARAELKAMMLAQQSAEIRRKDLSEKLSMLGVDVMGELNAIEERRLAARMEAEKLSSEKTMKRMQEQRAAGSRFETDQEWGSRVQSTLKTDQAIGEHFGYRRTPEMRQKAFERGLSSGPGAGKPLEERVSLLADDMEKTGLAKDATVANGVRQAIENVRKENSGDVTGVGGLYNLINQGSWLEATPLLSPAERALRSELSNMRDALVQKKRSGAASSEAEEQMYQYLVEGNKSMFASPEDMLAGVERVTRELDARLDNLAVKHGEDAAGEYFKRRDRSRASQTANTVIPFSEGR